MGPMATAAIHSPHCEFNDAAPPYGIRYWVRLAETTCADLGA